MTHEDKIDVGVIGTGFVARHFTYELERRPGYRLAKVLTRRPLDRCPDFPRADALTDSLDALIAASDVVFECTGDAFYAARTLPRVLDAGRPVVTLNAEFHATIGSQFVGRGLLSEAEGDQPGCLAALAEDAVVTGFTPLVYCNMKAFLNRNPSPEEMRYWAERQDYSVEMVTSFTDGTKVQIEQCLVANGLGAGIAKEDLIGLETCDLKVAAAELGAAADRLGHPISEYILDRGLQHGVFIIARHDPRQATPLRNFKLGDGPYYILIKDYCLVHLEVFKTLERVLRERRPLLNNGARPRVSVASVAKRELRPGKMIERGCGSFEVRGSCVNIAERPGHVPICLASRMRVRRRVEPGQILTMDDVELPETEALAAWQAIERRALAPERAVAC
jgi:predicted homoserine dehydrogenase-like protein